MEESYGSSTSNLSEFSDSAETEVPSSTSTTTTPSIFDKLKAPRLSDLSRKRRVKINRVPPTGKWRSKPRGTNDPKSVSPIQRVREHPDEHLSVSASKLFCNCCREELSLKSSSVKNHVKSDKHNIGKLRLKEKQAKERDIATALIAHNQDSHPQGETLPMNQQVYRVKVLRTFLKAGVPMNKMDHFRDILEEAAVRLTDRSHLMNLLPFILDEERNRLKTAISDENVSFIFDGTTRIGEALAIILRHVTSDFTIKQYLIRLQMLVKSMNGEELARELISCLSVSYGIKPESLLASMHDRAP